MKTILKIDKNGNQTLSIKTLDHKSFSIQTNGNLPDTHVDGITEFTPNEVINHLKCICDVSNLVKIVKQHSNWTGLHLGLLIHTGRVLYHDKNVILGFVRGALGEARNVEEFALYLKIVKRISKQ